MKESETIELKKSTSELKEAVISIVAILNKHGSGELYFGIRNDGTVIGQQVTEKTIRDISQALAEGIEPKIYPKIERVNIENRDCILITFSGESQPYFAFGRAYMRVGDEDRQLAVSEMEKLVLTKNKEKMQWDKQPAECEMKEIDLRTVKEFMKKANVAGRIDFRFDSLETTLTKLGLIVNGKLIRAAQVLFSSKNPIRVQAAVFAGKDKMTFLDIRQFEGNLFKLLEKSEEYLKEKMNWRVKFGKLEREEIPEIPIDALREALLNSLCHRDYQSPQSNYIAVYKDRIEIDNPGTFPENLEPNDYIFKDEPSLLRNPIIAECLYKTKDIEKWGSGLRRIYNECKENEIKVEFRKMKIGFKVVFYRREQPEGRKLQDSSDEGTDKVRRKYGESAEKVHRAISENLFIKTHEIAQKTGLSQRTVEKMIAILKKEGVLKRIGPDKGGHWEVVK